VKAEQCFVSGLGIASGKSSFQRLGPILDAPHDYPECNSDNPAQEGAFGTAACLRGPGEVEASDNSADLAAVLALKPFERFVFVMSVLEQYSDQDCKNSLGMFPPRHCSGTNSGSEADGHVKGDAGARRSFRRWWTFLAATVGGENCLIGD